MLSRNTAVLASVFLIASIVAVVGCGDVDEPLGPESGLSGSETETTEPTTSTLGRTALFEVLVPDGDLTLYVGWPAIPGDPAEAWSKIDEGVDNVDITDFIYAMDVGLVERLTFTDLSTPAAVVAKKLEFVVPLNVGLDTALQAGLTLSYFIDGVEEGSDTYQCGPIQGTSCGSTTWVVTFDNVCYSAAQIATLEIELTSIGTWWSPQMTQVMITALDCEVSYDHELTISNVVRSFDSCNCEFVTTWDTNVPSSSKVYWGFHPTQLNNVAVGPGNTTSHTVTIDPTGIPVRKRVYIKVESASGCDVAESDTAFTVRQYCISQ